MKALPMFRVSSFARLLLLILLGVLIAGRDVGIAAERLPNIVFIMVDDMGYGDPACYNPESKIPTPNIDSIAKAGMRFTDAHAPGPLCHMSRYGLLTGRYPCRTNVNRWPKNPLIENGQMTIASLLKSSGYRTTMVGKWHLGFRENGYENPLPGGPVDVGFDSFFGIRASTDIPPYFYIRGNKAVAPPTDRIEANNSKGWSPIQGKFWRAGGIAPDLQLKDVLPRFTEEAITVINDHAKTTADKKPLFLYLAYPAPHTPWLPDEEFLGKSGAGLYGDFAVMVDAMIGRVLKTLTDQGMEENTLVIFTSDNGPVWYENDVKRFGHDSSGGLRGMKADAWECGHRMPFIAKWPGKVPGGSVCPQTISFTDVLATFASLTESELSRNDGPDSFSFLPQLLGKIDQPVRESLAMKSGRFMTFRKGPWKLIEGRGSGGFSSPGKIEPKAGEPIGQLYNLQEDLAEQNNRYADEPELVRELKAELQKIQDQGHSR